LAGLKGCRMKTVCVRERERERERVSGSKRGGKRKVIFHLDRRSIGGETKREYPKEAKLIRPTAKDVPFGQKKMHQHTPLSCCKINYEKCY
jgi:hypothetical protein